MLQRYTSSMKQSLMALRMITHSRDLSTGSINGGNEQDYNE